MQLGERLRVGLAVDLDVDRRLGDAAVLDELLEVALLVAPHADDRADHQVEAAAVPGDLHRDRVDEERHVVVHELDDGVRRLPAVLFEGRVVDAHLQLARQPLLHQAPVRERRAGELVRRAGGEVLGRNVRVVGADPPLDVVGVGACLCAGPRHGRVQDRRLRLVDARRHVPLGVCRVSRGIRSGA